MIAEGRDLRSSQDVEAMIATLPPIAGPLESIVIGRFLDALLVTAGAIPPQRLAAGVARSSDLRQMATECVNAIVTTYQANLGASGRLQPAAGPRLRAVMTFLTAKCFEPDLSLSSVASAMHLSPAYLSRFIRRGIGITFSEYVRNLRLAEAKRMLADPTLSVKEIAAAVGYARTAELDRNFKNSCGMSPRYYRETNTGNR